MGSSFPDGFPRSHTRPVGDTTTGTDHPGSEDSNDLRSVAGSIAHDLNNLLSVVRNYATFIVDESADASPGSGAGRWRLVHRDAQQIEIAVERALLIVVERILPLASNPEQ